MANLKNHPGYWLRSDAAASLARWEADHGWINVTSAGRYEWEQQALIDRWIRGGKYNRPPYLYNPKRPARASEHVKNGGEAFDTNEHSRFRRTSADYGWWQPYEWDVVHFVYDPRRDKHRNRPAGGVVKPKPKPAPAPEPEPEPEPVLENFMAFKSVAVGYRPDDKEDRIVSTALDWEDGTKSDAIVKKDYGIAWYGALTEGGFLILTKGHYEDVLKEFAVATAAKREHELAVARARGGK